MKALFDKPIGSHLFTEDELVFERIKMLREYKKELRKHKDRRAALIVFKRLCRDRRFDAVAGHLQLMSGWFKKVL